MNLLQRVPEFTVWKHGFPEYGAVGFSEILLLCAGLGIRPIEFVEKLQPYKSNYIV